MFLHSAEDILRVLDLCAANYSFPGLDNGYVYLAATRLALFRSEADWAITTEVFGFSPRAGVPDLCIDTFASSLTNRKEPKDYGAVEAWRAYLARQPNNESLFINPIEGEDWIHEEKLAEGVRHVLLRDRLVSIPPLDAYQQMGIEHQVGSAPKVYEFCRWLVATQRDQVLATDAEQRHHLADSLIKIMQLDDWHHPDIVGGEVPSNSETFRQLAEVLVSGDLSHYKPSEPPNTHWSNWPDGGTLYPSSHVGAVSSPHRFRLRHFRP
jgi:hypothetical protein